MFRTTLAGLLLCGFAMAADAPATKKTTSEEKLAIRTAQVDVLSIQQEISRIEAQYRDVQIRLAAAQTKLSDAVRVVLEKYACKDCALTSDLDLEPTPIAASKK